MHQNEKINNFNVELNEIELNNLKLSESEINSIGGFDSLSSREKEELKEFVYNLSLILYKSYQYEQS